MGNYMLKVNTIFFAKLERKIGCEKGGLLHFYLQRSGIFRTFVLAIENQARRFRKSTKTKLIKAAIKRAQNQASMLCRAKAVSNEVQSTKLTN